MNALSTIKHGAAGMAGVLNRRVIGPRRHAGPLPYVRERPTVHPILPVAEMAEATAFYERLGFAVDAYDEGYAWVTHCGWEWLHLRRVDSVAGNRASAYLHVADADEWCAAIRSAADGDLEIADPIDTPWGKREFSIDDPAGNHLRFGSARTGGD